MESIKEICCVIGTSFNRFFPLGLPLLLPGPCFSLPSVDPPRWTPPPLTRILDPGLGLLSLGRRHFSGLGSSGEEDMQNTLLQTQNLHISVLFPSAAEAETNLRQTHYWRMIICSDSKCANVESCCHFTKHRKNRKTLPFEILFGCQYVNVIFT